MQFSRGELSKTSGSSKATVKEWQAGEAGPSFHAFLNLYCSMPEVREWLADVAEQNKASAAYSFLLKQSTRNDAEGKLAQRLLRAELRGDDP